MQPQSASLPLLIRASAKFHLRLGSPQAAAELLQEMHRCVLALDWILFCFICVMTFMTFVLSGLWSVVE